MYSDVELNCKAKGFCKTTTREDQLRIWRCVSGDQLFFFVFQAFLLVLVNVDIVVPTDNLLVELQARDVSTLR